MQKEQKGKIDRENWIIPSRSTFDIHTKEIDLFSQGLPIVYF